MVLLNAIGPCSGIEYNTNVRKEEFAKIQNVFQQAADHETNKNLMLIVGSKGSGKSCFANFVIEELCLKYSFFRITYKTQRLGGFYKLYESILRSLWNSGFCFVIENFFRENEDPKKVLLKLLPPEIQSDFKNFNNNVSAAFHILQNLTQFKFDNLFIIKKCLQPYLAALMTNILCCKTNLTGVTILLDEFEHPWSTWTRLQREAFWKYLCSFVKFIRSPMILCVTSNEKLLNNLFYIDAPIFEVFTNYEPIIFRDLSREDIITILQKYLQDINNKKREEILMKLEHFPSTSLREPLQQLLTLKICL